MMKMESLSEAAARTGSLDEKRHKKNKRYKIQEGCIETQQNGNEKAKSGKYILNNRGIYKAAQ